MPLAVKNNRLEEVPEEAVDYVIDNPTRLLGSHTNMIPLPNSVQGTRLFYGARFFNQAVPIVNGEAPLVQNMDPEDGISFDEKAGKNLGAVFSRKGGVVKKVTPDSIVLDTDEGPDEVPLYRNFILNRKSQINNTPLVKPGDAVQPGQLLARSNFTDDKGRMAMGLNARIALAPYKGYSMDDAIVMREGFARKLQSEAAYAHRLDFKNGVKGGKNHFTALFHDKFSRDQLKKLDDDGVIEIGQKVEPGDPLVLATKKRVISSQNLDLGGLSRYMQKSRADASEVWDHESPGEVVNVSRTRNGVKVDVVTQNATKVGDKVVMRQGGKAILSHVIPDDQMPRTEDGKPIDVLLNQLSLPSRVNAASLYEILLGKVARAKGEPIKVPPFLQKGERMHDYVKGLLDEYGIADKERVYDPVEDRWLDNPVTVGEGYIMKLHHEVESKRSERGQAGYDCFDSATEVLTKRGWVPWPDVVETDELYTLDTDVGKMVYEKPEKLVSYDFDGELHTYKSKFLDWAVTANHRFPLVSSNTGKLTMCSSEDLRKKRKANLHQFGLPVYEGKNPDTFVFPPATLPGTQRSKKWSIPLEVPFDVYVRFMAWWLPEGSVQHWPNEGRYRVHIFKHKNVNPKDNEEIRCLFGSMGFEPHEAGRESGWYIHDARVSSYLSQFGKAHTKFIPDDILYASIPMRELFLNTTLRGDGGSASYIKPGREKENHVKWFGSVSKDLVDTFQILCVGLGVGYIYREYPAIPMKSRTCDKTYMCRPGYTGHIHLWRKLASVVPETPTNRYKGKHGTISYKGKVYCAHMRTGLLYVRRNGFPFLSGNSWSQPARGGFEGGKAKRLSGLETTGLLSAGAYNVLRESSTLRGSRNDEFWRQVRMGQDPKEPGVPFAWKRYMGMLSGAGLAARPIEGEKGGLRLGFYTDKDLDRERPVEIDNGEVIDTSTLAPVKGGLFDDRVTIGNKWGAIPLDEALPNPAAEKVIRKLLGLTEKEYREILSGERELPT